MRVRGATPSDGRLTVVRCERTRTEAPSDGAERWRLPGWFPPRTAIRPSYTSAATRAAPSPCCQPCSPLLSLRPPRSLALFSPPRIRPSCLQDVCVRMCVYVCVVARDAVSMERRATMRSAARIDARSVRVLSDSGDDDDDDGHISRDHGKRDGGVIDFLSPSSVTRAHAHCNAGGIVTSPVVLSHSSGMSQAVRIYPRRAMPAPTFATDGTDAPRTRRTKSTLGFRCRRNRSDIAIECYRDAETSAPRDELIPELMPLPRVCNN